MSTIPKPGDLVLIKTTEEPVIVLETWTVSHGEWFGKLPSNTQLRVRRPVAGQNGISHQIDNFFLEEVEFPNDRSSRLRAEYTAMQQAENSKVEPAATDSASKSSIN